MYSLDEEMLWHDLRIVLVSFVTNLLLLFLW